MNRRQKAVLRYELNNLVQILPTLPFLLPLGKPISGCVFRIDHFVLRVHSIAYDSFWKSNHILLVTFTYLVDVNAGVAKCLWYIGKRLGIGQVPGVYVWMWGSSGVTPVIIHYPAAVWEAMTHTRSRNRMHGQTHANTTRTQTHSSDTVCTGTPAPQKFQWIKWNMHMALI